MSLARFLSVFVSGSVGSFGAAAVCLAAPAAASDPQFRAAIAARVTAEHLTLCRWGRVDLDGDGTPERFAWVREQDPVAKAASHLPHVWLVLEQARGVRHVFTAPEEPDEFRIDCPRTPGALPKWESLGTAPLALVIWGPTGSAGIRYLGIRAGELALLRTTYGDRYQSSDWNFEALSFTAGDHARDEEAAPAAPTEGAMLLLRPLGASWPDPAATRNWVVYGKKKWSGPSDAAVHVLARPAPADAVELELRTQDDLAVPLLDERDDKAWLAADHLELWLCRQLSPSAAPVEAAASAACSRERALQLGIARTATGSLVRRWLYPPASTQPLPPVVATAAGVAVTLPRSLLACAALGQGWMWPEGVQSCPLTVVYSDTDHPGAGQEKLVATSRLKWGEPQTFGALVRLSERARYPVPTSRRLTASERLNP